MVKNQRKIPIRLNKDHALLRRLLPDHQKKKEIVGNIRKLNAGWKGEKELDYHLSFLPENDFLIFQGLHLPLFQIDAFVLCSHFGVIIECKNWAGTLSYDPRTEQMIRHYDGKKEGFPDPLLQAQRQKIQLEKWLTTHKFKPFPIFYLAAISFSSTLIDSSAKNTQLFNQLMLAEKIPYKIMQLKEQQQNQTPLSAYQLNKISELFLLHNSPPLIDILDFYQLQPKDLLIGVPCPICSPCPMKRVHGGWRCDRCHHFAKQAHEQVILDDLLIYRQMTNVDFQRTLSLPSAYTVYRLLAPMNLPFIGKSKNRIYFSPDQD